jgi:HEAT repeat protein
MSTRVLVLTIVVFASQASLAADELYTKADGILQEGLASRNPDTRKHAVAALSLAIPRKEYLSRALGMLNDKDAEVRIAAVSSVSEVNTPAVTAALRKMLDDSVPEVSFGAAKALWALHDPSGKRALKAVLEGETKASSGFLSKQKREALRMLHTPRTALLFAARQGAAFAPVPGLGGGIASLQAILTDPEVSGRAAAALLLAQRRDATTLQALREAPIEKDASLRSVAVHLLATTNNTAYRKDLTPLLDDEKETVRLRAAAGYIRLSSVGSTRMRPNRPASPSTSKGADGTAPPRPQRSTATGSRDR